MTANIVDQYRVDQRRKARAAEQDAEAMAFAKQQARAEFLSGLGRSIDRVLMEIATHIPVGVAVVVSCYGEMQFGAFGMVFAAMSLGLSLLLSRSYALWGTCHNGDVRVFLPILAVGAFLWECYFVHFGLEAFNAANAKQGLMTFAPEALVAGSIILGLYNLFSRRAYVTGHEKAASDATAPESYYRSRKKADRLVANIGRNEQRTAQMEDGTAVEIFIRHGAWPLGYKPTEAALAEVARRA